MHPYGNDPAKLDRYRAFWARGEARRPLVGFTMIGWYPLEEFSAARAWGDDGYITLDMIEPEAFLEDHLRALREGETMDDDLIRGASPLLVALPWLPAMLDCRLRLLPQNILGEERRLDWGEALKTRFDPDHPWFRRFMQFAGMLVREADGRFPVSHSPELGPTDLHAVLRGHNESILDLADEPEQSAALLVRTAEIFRDLMQTIWRGLPRWHDGYYDAQYSLWSPGSIVRMQEDATAVYSPALYRRFVQPVDRMIARSFESSFIHLHSTSMFLLEAILEIEEIRCVEINNDVGGPPLSRMVRYFQRVQERGRPLLVRGSFKPDELRFLADSLDPRGLFFNIMVTGMPEVEQLRPILGM